jgi:hypothetical protein
MRERLIQQDPASVICTGLGVDPAVTELYSEIMINYLPYRYPTIFKISGANVHNTITGGSYPLSTTGLTAERMLQLLGVNVEDDFFFMCPDDSDGEFRLAGCVACFPNGFVGPEHVGQSVRQIHQPVPGYEQRLGNGVDRYFQRMKPGKFIERVNVSILPSTSRSTLVLITTLTCASGVFKLMAQNSSAPKGSTIILIRRNPDTRKSSILTSTSVSSASSSRR